MSPASPEKAIKVCLLSSFVLSSEALRIVAPLMAAFEAATSVKSFPVIPSKTSLETGQDLVSVVRRAHSHLRYQVFRKVGPKARKNPICVFKAS